MNTPAEVRAQNATKGARRASQHADAPAPEPVKCIVLDTSVVMADPTAHLEYADAEVVVPLTVIDELDGGKVRSDAAGRNARHFLNTIEGLRRAQGGGLADAFDLGNGSTLRIEPNGLYLDALAKFHLDPAVPDHRILASALGLATDTTRHVIVVSNDTALRVKATVLGLDAAEHTPGRIGVHAPNRRGYHQVDLSAGAVSAIAHVGRGGLAIANLPDEDQEVLKDVFDNEFILINGTAVTAKHKGGRLYKLTHYAPWGAKPLNKEQAFALDLLADPEVLLVALRGHAGTGKSLCGFAAGLQAVIEDKTHDQLLILRPMVSVGRQDLGFLPGDVAEKTQPWFDAIVDVLIALSEPDRYGRKLNYKEAKTLLDGFIADGKVVLAPVTFLRGRTFHRTFAILDEAQNVEPTVVKTVISRLGDGSRLVLNGDDGQLDVPFTSAMTCGLNVAVDAFAGVDLFGQVFFSKGERSRLADLAAERM